MASRPHKLLVEFDEQLLLIVTEPFVRSADEAAVELGFASLTFDWQGYGDLEPHVSTYSSGLLGIWLV